MNYKFALLSFNVAVFIYFTFRQQYYSVLKLLGEEGVTEMTRLQSQTGISWTPVCGVETIIWRSHSLIHLDKRHKPILSVHWHFIYSIRLWNTLYQHMEEIGVTRANLPVQFSNHMTISHDNTRYWTRVSAVRGKSFTAVPAQQPVYPCVHKPRCQCVHKPRCQCVSNQDANVFTN